MISNKPKNDQLFRKAMENPIVAHEFLSSHLPKTVLAAIDSTTLKLEKETYVEPDLISSSSDVVFSAKFNNFQNNSKEDGYIFLLLEHQSSPDHMMAFRLFKYCLRICDRYMSLNPKAKNLPLVYPLVLYNGTRKYDAPLNIWELFGNKELAKNFWVNDYQLINVHEIPDEELKKRVWSGILEFFLKHINERQLLKRWEEIAEILPELTKVTVGYDYIEMMLYFTLPFIDKNDKMALGKLLTTKISKDKGEEIMASLAEAWKEEGIEIGIQDGIKIGEARGKAEGKAELIRMMLKSGNSIETISKMTSLSIAEIRNLTS